MALKVCDVETQRYHQTALGMACSAVADGSPLDTIFVCGEEEADKFCTGSRGRDNGIQGFIEGLLANEELEVSEEEKNVGGFGAAPAVFPWPEEEE